MTDSTPTAPLDLIEQGLREAAEDRRIAAMMKQDRNRETLIRRAGVTEALVEEVKNLRASLHLSMGTLKDACDVLFEASGLDARYEAEVDLIHETVMGMRADRDAAIARAEAAEAKVEQLRGQLLDAGNGHQREIEQHREALAERDQERAKVTAGLALADRWSLPSNQIDAWLPDVAKDLRAALTEVQAGAGAEGGKDQVEVVDGVTCSTLTTTEQPGHICDTDCYEEADTGLVKHSIDCEVSEGCAGLLHLAGCPESTPPAPVDDREALACRLCGSSDDPSECLGHGLCCDSCHDDARKAISDVLSEGFIRKHNDPGLANADTWHYAADVLMAAGYVKGGQA